jgi:hypothetical protein
VRVIIFITDERQLQPEIETFAPLTGKNDPPTPRNGGIKYTTHGSGRSSRERVSVVQGVPWRGMFEGGHRPEHQTALRPKRLNVQDRNVV